MKYETLSSVVESVKGSTFAGLTTRTKVKLKGGKKNPMQDRVTKKTSGANVMIFSSVECSAYEGMVKRRLEKEGKDPTTFTVKPRAWGNRVGKTPFIEHKDKHYIEVFFVSPGKTTYYLDDKEIDVDDIEGLTTKVESDTSQGGLEDKVVIRTFSLDSIEEIRMMGTTITKES